MNQKDNIKLIAGLMQETTDALLKRQKERQCARITENTVKRCTVNEYLRGKGIYG